MEELQTNDSDKLTDKAESEGSYTYCYPRPAVSADCCIFAFVENELSVLLVRRGAEPFSGRWALPGGFMRMDETAEQCARRELVEETGYEVKRLTQFGAYSEVDRDPRGRVLTIAFYALAQWETVLGGDDADDARWFPLSALPDLAFDHKRIIKDAMETMRRDIYFEPIGFELLPHSFSMPELQKMIETITGDKYDRRNFYNKMRHCGFVTELDFRTDSRYSSYFAEDNTLIRDLPRRKRVRYQFNPDAFAQRKKRKGSGPITY